MSPGEEKLIDTLTAFFCCKGSIHEHDNPAIHRARIQFEWQSGQWIMLTDKINNRLFGWISFFLVNEETLKLFDSGEYENYIQKQIPLDLINGEHIYIPTIVVTPWAPNMTYRRLNKMTMELNPEAKSFNAHIRKRNGKIRYVQRKLG